MPLTAHFLGGCPIGDSPRHGVIDPYHRLYGHPGITSWTASAVSANLGVNPSLTITAQAERAMSFWPNQRRARTRVRRRARAYERLDAGRAASTRRSARRRRRAAAAHRRIS